MKKLLSLTLSALLLLACFSAIGVAAADTYASDGIVAWYDGSEYDGASWTDLSGNGNDLAVTADKFQNGAYYSEAEKVYFTPDVVDTIAGDEFTTEMVIGATEQTGATWSTYLNSTNDNYSLFTRVSDSTLVLKNNPNDRPTAIDGRNKVAYATVSITLKVGGEVVMYINGVQVAKQNCNGALGVDDFYFGHDDSSKSHNTEYRQIRIYDRALTADEIAANYAADKATYTSDPDVPVEEPEVNNSLALNKPYTAVINDLDDGGAFRDDGYGDGIDASKQLLTNGVDNFAEIAGYQSASVDIILDMEGAGKNMATFNIDLFYGNWGIPAPESIEYFISDDGTNWTSIGKVSLTDAVPLTGVADGWSASDFTLTLNTPVDAQLVKAELRNPEGATKHLWPSEFNIYTAEGSSEESSKPESEVSTPASESSKPAQNSSSAPVTGDTGIAALILLALVATVGVVACKKSR